MERGNKLVWHQIVLIFVLLFLTILRLITGRWELNVNLLWWWLGGAVGFLFVFLDRLIHSFFTSPNETLSMQIKDLFKKRKIIEGLALALSEKEQQQNLMMRSALFIVVWLALSFWAATSVTNDFSRGFMLGLGTHLFFDLLWDYSGRGRLIDHWFWQIKRKIPVNEIRIFVWITSILYVLLAFAL